VLFSGAARRENQLRNQRKLLDMYSRQADHIDRLVRAANRRIGLLPHRRGERCGDILQWR